MTRAMCRSCGRALSEADDRSRHAESVGSHVSSRKKSMRATSMIE